MPLKPWLLADADLAFDPHWLTAEAAQALFAGLLAHVPWEVHRIRLFGREVDSPRLSCWIGDPDAAYTYSGSRFAPRPWPDALMPIRERLSLELGIGFNSVLANLYRDGSDSMGWHSDSEAELGPQPTIASVSLGATRRFALKQRRDPSVKLAVDLPPGSLLVMRGDTQANYRHALPRTAKPVGARINLTFRRIVPGVRSS
ncbi:alpha-ketoglutarate-dependent dioxygenase AlkB [Luteimonas sp. SX5]|uniref:Alpha-ketoglutarate-dependent dioxygenase AlkB n=1 Tax=Luteimonas galliterrae TaxID=2940486 RepID=A0ABT0MIC1_9GAMM|nr:alpha-ketoglutarate-dependent dioxygenase AlkB [Luteimonas galliterrae]MCL1634617.1 alpha-ketoglutarate-dependent dioxygenase AlkB [Luteimonas galliterrae]